MDSLTQIVLGAACGQLVLGKKIGNKALLFGAIGGTLPDLDVFVGRWIYANEIQTMAFHRGFMHSIIFALLGAFLFGWLTYKIYNSGKRKETTTQKDWILLFFWAIFTHPLLDCFTPYGTQLFAPFSNYRVAFNTISIVDPLYTLPFLISMIVVLCFKRSNSKRLLWTKIGIFSSTFYLLFTVANKLYIDAVFKKSFDKAGISIHRFSAQPTIMNTFLWYSVAETADDYHLAFYSLLDQSNFSEKIITVPKNHELLDVSSKNLQTLSWFSNGYFNLSPGKQEDTYTYVDLRYPILNPEDEKTALFKFTLIEKNKQWDMLPFTGNPPTKEDFEVFFNRVKGI